MRVEHLGSIFGKIRPTQKSQEPPGLSPKKPHPWLGSIPEPIKPFVSGVLFEKNEGVEVIQTADGPILIDYGHRAIIPPLPK